MSTMIIGPGEFSLDKEGNLCCKSLTIDGVLSGGGGGIGSIITIGGMDSGETIVNGKYLSDIVFDTNAAIVVSKDEISLKVSQDELQTMQTTVDLHGVSLMKVDGDFDLVNAELLSVQADATTANLAIAAMSSDGVISAVEKKILKKEWDGIILEKSKIDIQADSYKVNRMTYDLMYDTLNAYIQPFFVDLTMPTNVVAYDMETNFSNYYTARLNLLEAIDMAIKAEIDDINNNQIPMLVTRLSRTESSIIQLMDSITLSVTNETLSSAISTIDSNIATVSVQSQSYTDAQILINLQGINLKVDMDTYNSYTSNIGGKLIDMNSQLVIQTSDIAILQGQISLTVNKTEIDNINDTIGGLSITVNIQSSAITELSNEISLKASQTDLYDTNGSVLSAQAAAVTAQAQADMATLSSTLSENLIDDLANDGMFTPTEKKSALQEWNLIVTEVVQDDAQAVIFSIGAEKTNYDLAYSNLNTYIIPFFVDMTTTVAIVGATFDSTWKAYYDSRTILLNAIALAAKTIADIANSAAGAATIAAGVAAGAAADANARAGLAIDATVGPAAYIDNLADDSVITPDAKVTLQQEWNLIVIDGTVTTGKIDALAISISNTISCSAFDSAYNTLNTYLNTTLTLFSDLTSPTTGIVRNDWNNDWQNYYGARTDLLNAISSFTKASADVANTNASLANTAASNAASAASSANAAASAAQDTANTAKIYTDNLASDSVITQDEKISLKQDWNLIVTEATATSGTIPAQAISFGVSHSSFDSYYSTLNTYLNTTLTVFSSMATATTGIVRTTWDANWQNYYGARTALLNAIATQANSNASAASAAASAANGAAGAAQGTANSANGTANTLANTTVPNLTTRVSNAESVITPGAITNTVTTSSTYVNAMGQKITSAQASSLIQTGTDVVIGFNKIASSVVTINSSGLYVTNGSINCNVLNGGTLTLGGGSNISGILEVIDRYGTKVASITNVGIFAKQIDLSGEGDSGAYIEYDAEGYTHLYNQNGGIIIQSSGTIQLENTVTVGASLTVGGGLVTTGLTCTAPTLLSGTTYPNLYGNGSNLQLAYTNSSSSGVILSSGYFRPAGNGHDSLGASNYAWKQIYAASSTISASDRTMKNTINTLDSSKSMSLLMGIDAVSYKFNDGESNRLHYGMISQQIEDLLASLGMTSLDFAGFIKTPKTQEIIIDNIRTLQDIPNEYNYGLRYEEFISLLIRVVQIIKIEKDKDLVRQDALIISLQNQVSDLNCKISQQSTLQKQIDDLNVQMSQVLAK